FIIIDDEDVTRDVVLDMPFFMKYVSCQMVMKKFAHRDKGSGGESFWEEGDDFGVDVLHFHTCLTNILGFLERLEWWFEQYIDDEGEEDEEGKGGSEV
ncbi:hypothetical protein Tco_0139293, partial [Tanacetum coccineum]